MRAIIFAEQFYYPEGWGGAQLARDVTTHLRAEGWQVHVICGSDIYAAPGAANIEDPRKAGVRVTRIPRILSGKVHRFKLLRHLWFYVAAFPLLLFGRAAVYVTQTNPPLIVPIAAFAAWIRRRPLVVVAQDIYPEVLFAHGMVGPRSLAAKLLRGVFRWAYTRARCVISLGPTMSQRLLAKGVGPAAIAEISNWATGEESVVRGPENSLRAAWGLDGKFIVLYSGNMGVAHDVMTPLRAAAAALDRIPNLVLLFIGDGVRVAEAQRAANELGIAHAVHFHPFVSLDLLPHSLGLADLALVSLQPGFEGLVVPSKLLGYMARAIPTFYVGPPSDVSFYLDESSGGLHLPNGDHEGLAAALIDAHLAPLTLTAMGLNAQRYYASRLARSVALAQYDRVVSGVLQPSVAAAGS